MYKRQLYTRYEEEGGDFSQEIAVYQKAVEAQSEILLQLAQQEIDSINELTQLLA